MVEVKTILKHKPRGEDGHDMADNFMKALWEGQKDFVSHPFYQQYLWKQMTGSSKKGSQYRFSEPLWNIIYVPYALLLFCCYPLVVFADFFRNADILFVQPKDISKPSNPSSTVKSQISNYYFLLS